MQIKNIGSLHHIDEKGYIGNPTKYPVQQAEYAKVVEYVLAQVKSILKQSVHSAYLRGSVAKGQAVPFISDVDILIIVNAPVTAEEDAQLLVLKENISSVFPFVTKVEILVEGLSQTEKSWLKFLMKTQCVCIYGTDLIPNIQPFKIGKEVYAHSLHIVKQMEEIQKEFDGTDDEEDIKSGCVWIMKALVRAGFELVMERDQSYTRDLYPAYERFSKYYPEKEKEMRRILTLAIYPTTNKAEINELLNGIKPFMTEHTKHLGR